MPSRTRSALLAAALISACARGGPAADRPAAPPAAPVVPAAAAARLVVPEVVRHAPQVVVTGTLKARQAAPLAPCVPGTLARIAVRRGQEVRQGALLAALDDGMAQATRRQGEAGVGAARAQLALAEDALSRVERLRREEGASESQLVVARAQRDLAQAQLGAAEAQLEQARVNLAHHSLTAPFPGVVTSVPDGIGLTVAAGTTLVSLADTRRLVLQTSLTQEEAAEVRAGDRVRVSVPATGACTQEGVITAVVPAVDPGTSRVPVEIEVPNGDGRFFANAFARAELPRGAERTAYRVPAAALVQRTGGFAVWVAGPDSLARTLPVRVLAEEGATSVVLPADGRWPEGLRVVDLPPQGIAEGTPLAEVRG
ncbi:MAG TPA: efflux RND transporter periplasmic adaptor subunit [Anaeromyxobacter sp.]|nr:efflux RND transporter periplasmic adaptor subunit [Anaeromyxobacter sp.]